MNDYKTFNDMGIERTWEELYEDNVMLKKENQQLNEDIKVLFKENCNKEEVIKRCEDNWNKLKEYVEKAYNNGERIDTKEIKDKMRELESRCK